VADKGNSTHHCLQGPSEVVGTPRYLIPGVTFWREPALRSGSETERPEIWSVGGGSGLQ
jgi:hypothetical protein